jgi:protein-disulfide isomerase
VDLEDHAEGRLDATITLVQYGDYECPFTRQSRNSVRILQRELGERLLFVFRHFPLEELHPHARAAAAAVEAAAAQGEFWTMHHYLFEHQQALETDQLRQYAVELGLDSDRFDRDRTSPEIAARIDRDLTSGWRSGVESTPAFFINGVRHDGTYVLESLRSAIVAALSGDR